MGEQRKEKSSARLRADEIKSYRCKNLIAVIEDPHDKYQQKYRKRNKRVKIEDA
jgi:hypothetical protein|tara:strand:+ start:214 stop:375 length:162 start_codon:yes stop_codon:yes gene_type:complete